MLPLTLRLWPIQHGLPRNYVPDTHLVRNALGMARDANPVPRVGEYSTYPYLLSYALLPVYAAQYALGRARGEWGGAQEFGFRLLEEPQRAHLPARWLVALIASLAPWIVLRGGRAMGLGRGAWVAAYLVATGLLHLQFSVQERPWAPLVTFLALAAWPAARHVESGRQNDLLFSGLAAALAFSCHQAGVLGLAIPGVAWLLGPVGWRGHELRRRLASGVLCVLVFALLSLAVGHPYYVVHGWVERADVAAGDALGSNAVTIGGQAWIPTFRPETFVKLGSAFAGYDPVLLALGIAGLPFVLARRAALPAVLFALGWAALFLFGQGDHTRYLLPLSVLLAWPAGRVAELCWRRPVARAVLLAALVVPLVQALRLGWVLRQEDTRSLAATRLAEVAPGAPIAVDVHGPELSLDRESLERLARWRELGARERHRLRYFSEWNAVPPDGPGFDALPLEAIFAYDRRESRSWVEPEHVDELGSDPNEVLRRLGRELLLVVDRTPDDGRPPILLDPAAPAEGPKMPPVRVERPPVFTVHPAGPDGRARFAGLPTELTFALTQIWQVERPGPELELYRLPE